MATRTNRVAWWLVAVLTLVAKSSHATSVAPGIVRVPMRVTRQGKSWRIVLAPALGKAVAAHFLGYSLPRLAWFDTSLNVTVHAPKGDLGPFACIGDFDGNGLPDAALLLHKQRRRWLLVVLDQSFQGTFRTHILERFTAKDIRLWSSILDHRYTFTLACIDKAQAREEAMVHTKGDAIVFGGPESFTLYYYRQGRYHAVDDTAE